MKVNEVVKGDVTILEMSGRITIGKGDIALREAVNLSLDKDAHKILLDLSGVNYMDSAGIGELVACSKRVKERGGRLKLLSPSAKVHELLALTQLAQIFEIYSDAVEAVASFQQ